MLEVHPCLATLKLPLHQAMAVDSLALALHLLQRNREEHQCLETLHLLLPLVLLPLAVLHRLEEPLLHLRHLAMAGSRDSVQHQLLLLLVAGLPALEDSHSNSLKEALEQVPTDSVDNQQVLLHNNLVGLEVVAALEAVRLLLHQATAVVVDLAWVLPTQHLNLEDDAWSEPSDLRDRYCTYVHAHIRTCLVGIGGRR